MKKTVLILFILSILLPAQAQKFPISWYRAQAAMDNGEYSQAMVWIDSALMINPTNPNFWLKRGELQLNANNFKSALIDFQNAEKHRVGVASIWLARTYAILSDTANAFAQLKIHLESPEKESESSIILDKAFNELKQTPQWNRLWLTEWYSPAEKLVSEIAYHFSHQRWNEAIDILNQRIEGRSARHQLYSMRGEAYFNTGSFKAAEADFSHAINKSKKNHEYIAWLGRIQTKQGKFSKAINNLNQAIDYSGGDPKYFIYRAEAFSGDKNFDAAVVDMDYYLTFYPNNLSAIEQYAVYAADAGKYLTALSQLSKLIKTSPNNPKFYIQRGNIFMKSENWSMAEMDFAMSLDYDPSNAEVYLQKGFCRYYLDDISGACNDWKNALRLGSFQAQELLFKYCKGEK